MQFFFLDWQVLMHRWQTLLTAVNDYFGDDANGDDHFGDEADGDDHFGDGDDDTNVND